MTDNLNETAEERQCLCCGSYDGDPYAILSNGYCIPCNRDAEISCLETEARLFAVAESLRYDRLLC